MARIAYPLVLYFTHDAQTPSDLVGSSGGQSRFAPVSAWAAVFFVTHESPLRQSENGLFTEDRRPGREGKPVANEHRTLVATIDQVTFQASAATMKG